jgi:Predicted AAA-ATPase
MSNNNKNSSKTDRPSEIVDAGSSAKKSRESFHFPGRHQTGAAGVYNRDRGHRDNSPFLGRLFNNNNKAICFARPMQLGKTTLFSLANELFSVNECPNMDTELIEYSPNDDDRNKWFVLRIDFGAICPTHSERNEEEDWAALCERLDKDTGSIIKTEVLLLLLANPQLKTVFDTVSLGVPITEQSIIVLVTCLFKAVKAEKGRLLILVDEYDRPVREGLLQLIPSHAETLYEHVRSEIRACYRNYFGFFRAVKTLLEGLPQSKIWLTGITPIGISEMSGLNVTRLTFNDDMADAVGLTESDVRQMLKNVRQHAQFEFTDNEFECAMESLKRHFNNLRFPGSQSLYHTALVNCIMNMLLDEPIKRKEFLEKGLVRRYSTSYAMPETYGML